MTDQEASNGVIHVINEVLTEIPTKNIVQFVAGNSDFSSLVYAVVRANIASKLQGKYVLILYLCVLRFFLLYFHSFCFEEKKFLRMSQKIKCLSN